jgi:hypothetical protein
MKNKYRWTIISATLCWLCFIVNCLLFTISNSNLDTCIFPLCSRLIVFFFQNSSKIYLTAICSDTFICMTPQGILMTASSLFICQQWILWLEHWRMIENIFRCVDIYLLNIVLSTVRNTKNLLVQAKIVPFQE